MNSIKNLFRFFLIIFVIILSYFFSQFRPSYVLAAIDDPIPSQLEIVRIENADGTYRYLVNFDDPASNILNEYTLTWDLTYDPQAAHQTVRLDINNIIAESGINMSDLFYADMEQGGTIGFRVDNLDITNYIDANTLLLLEDYYYTATMESVPSGIGEVIFEASTLIGRHELYADDERGAPVCGDCADETPDDSTPPPPPPPAPDPDQPGGGGLAITPDPGIDFFETFDCDISSDPVNCIVALAKNIQGLIIAVSILISIFMLPMIGLFLASGSPDRIQKGKDLLEAFITGLALVAGSGIIILIVLRELLGVG